MLQSQFKKNVALLLLPLFFASTLVFAVFELSNVRSSVTHEDKVLFAQKFGDLNVSHGDYLYELRLIQEIQERILRSYPIGEGIPIRREREPTDLNEVGAGLCYDRSRMLYKAYSWLGFRARQTFLLFPYDQKGNRINSIFAFLSDETVSHAVVEVLTAKGWLVVDTNSPWVSNTTSDIPVSASDIIKRKTELKDIPWNYERYYIAIRGLLSRNGLFYPPYNRIPDVYWPDLLFSNF
jgi:hypothetical protein